MQILIAEDDLTSRTILAAILQKLGFDPIEVGDGGAAWAAMQQPLPPGLAILDWEMPGMSGIEVCRKIREQNSANPPYIIILTARQAKADIVNGLEAGANDYITKPYDNDELRARVQVGRRMVDLQAELIAAKDALAHEAMYDSLTGALNRRVILETLDKELKRAKRGKTSVSIGLFDIDHFKKVNDVYGHQAGDEVLCKFVRTIQSNLRNYDYVGRYGGEEFLVVAPDSTGTPNESLYERLRIQIARISTVVRGVRINITASVGVAGSNGSTTVETLVAAADAALYRAKDEGRNRVVYK